MIQQKGSWSTLLTVAHQPLIGPGWPRTKGELNLVDLQTVLQVWGHLSKKKKKDLELHTKRILDQAPSESVLQCPSLTGRGDRPPSSSSLGFL